MTLVGDRVADRKVLRLVRAFLRAGVIEQHGGFAASLTGTPQGGIISPLLANIYLSVLDRAFQAAWDTDMASPRRRSRRRHKGLATYRLVRYSDDFVVLLKGVFCTFRGSNHVAVSRPGRGGQRPPKLSMARAMSASGEWNPNARRINSRSLVLRLSTLAFDSP